MKGQFEISGVSIEVDTEMTAEEIAPLIEKRTGIKCTVTLDGPQESITDAMEE